MATEQQGFLGLPRLAIAEGAATPDPGIAGVYAWSTTLVAPVYWNGTKWSAIPVGFNAGAWRAPLFTHWNANLGTWLPGGSSATKPGIHGMPALTDTGTATTRAVDTTNALRRQKRIGFVSATTAGSVSGTRLSANNPATLGNDTDGGFLFSCVFGCSDAATVSGARQFVGLRAATVAPTNVEPSTLTNAIGVGHGAADSNLKIYSGGSAAQTPIDLGGNFPANSLSADGYLLVLYAPQTPTVDGYKVGWYVKRLGTSFVASGILTGTAGTELPALTQGLTLNHYRSNNATALAVGLDIGAMALALPFPLL